MQIDRRGFSFKILKMTNGFIKLHRSLVEWEWYDDVNTFKLFIHILLMANHKDNNYRGEVVKRGTFLTGLNLLSQQTKLSVQNVRTSLNRLKSTNEITIKTSSKGTVIQVVNYDKFQQVTNELTNNQQASNKQVTTNKNDKKEKKEVYRQFDHLKITVDEIEKLKEIYTINQINDILDSIENYKNNKNYKSLYLTARKWLKKEHPKQTTPDVKEFTLAEKQVGLSRFGENWKERLREMKRQGIKIQ